MSYSKQLTTLKGVVVPKQYVDGEINFLEASKFLSRLGFKKDSTKLMDSVLKAVKVQPNTVVVSPGRYTYEAGQFIPLYTDKVQDWDDFVNYAQESQGRWQIYDADQVPEDLDVSSGSTDSFLFELQDPILSLLSKNEFDQAKAILDFYERRISEQPDLENKKSYLDNIKELKNIIDSLEKGFVMQRSYGLSLKDKENIESLLADPGDTYVDSVEYNPNRNSLVLKKTKEDPSRNVTLLFAASQVVNGRPVGEVLQAIQNMDGKSIKFEDVDSLFEGLPKNVVADLISNKGEIGKLLKNSRGLDEAEKIDVVDQIVRVVREKSQENIRSSQERAEKDLTKFFEERRKLAHEDVPQGIQEKASLAQKGIDSRMKRKLFDNGVDMVEGLFEMLPYEGVMDLVFTHFDIRDVNNRVVTKDEFSVADIGGYSFSPKIKTLLGLNDFVKNLRNTLNKFQATTGAVVRESLKYGVEKVGLESVSESYAKRGEQKSEILDDIARNVSGVFSGKTNDVSKKSQEIKRSIVETLSSFGITDINEPELDKLVDKIVNDLEKQIDFKAFNYSEKEHSKHATESIVKFAAAFFHSHIGKLYSSETENYRRAYNFLSSLLGEDFLVDLASGAARDQNNRKNLVALSVMIGIRALPINPRTNEILWTDEQKTRYLEDAGYNGTQHQLLDDKEILIDVLFHLAKNDFESTGSEVLRSTLIRNLGKVTLQGQGIIDDDVRDNAKIQVSNKVQTDDIESYTRQVFDGNLLPDLRDVFNDVKNTRGDLKNNSEEALRVLESNDKFLSAREKFMTNVEKTLPGLDKLSAEDKQVILNHFFKKFNKGFVESLTKNSNFGSNFEDLSHVAVVAHLAHSGEVKNVRSLDPENGVYFDPNNVSKRGLYGMDGLSWSSGEPGNEKTHVVGTQIGENTDAVDFVHVTLHDQHPDDTNKSFVEITPLEVKMEADSLVYAHANSFDAYLILASEIMQHQKNKTGKVPDVSMSELMNMNMTQSGRIEVSNLNFKFLGDVYGASGAQGTGEKPRKLNLL